MTLECSDANHVPAIHKNWGGVGWGVCFVLVGGGGWVFWEGAV